jgi:hypothetical protein
MSIEYSGSRLLLLRCQPGIRLAASLFEHSPDECFGPLSVENSHSYNMHVLSSVVFAHHRVQQDFSTSVRMLERFSLPGVDIRYCGTALPLYCSVTYGACVS